MSADDFRLLQELFHRIAESLQLPLEEAEEQQHKLLDILYVSTSAKIDFPVNEALVDPAKILWQTPVSILPTHKHANKKYHVCATDVEFLFSQCTPNSLVVDAVQEKDGPHHSRMTPCNKDWKQLDLFSHKAYSSATLQFCIANYEAIMAK